MTLNEFFKENPKTALAFSGGVDSSYLLYAARQAGAEVHAYYVKTAFQPEFEYEDAMGLAKQLGAQVTVLRLNALSDPQVAANPANRCYYCKQNIFGNIWRAARADGFTVLLDGTNASDQAGDRPGMKALQELQVRSPLREAGLTKAMIREKSREAGLFTWDKPHRCDHYGGESGKNRVGRELSDESGLLGPAGTASGDLRPGAAAGESNGQIHGAAGDDPCSFEDALQRCAAGFGGPEWTVRSGNCFWVFSRGRSLWTRHCCI